jgi:hypothetical protein
MTEKRSRWRAVILTLLAVAGAGCVEERPIDGGEKPPYWGPEWTQQPSGCWADSSSIFFVRARDSSAEYGVYRVVYPNARTIDSIAVWGDCPAVSPCGDKVAYSYGNQVWVRDITNDSGGRAMFLLDGGDSSTIVSLGWRGCDTVLFTQFPVEVGVQAIDLETHEVSAVTSVCRQPSASRDGKTIACANFSVIYTVVGGQAEKVLQVQDSSHSIRYLQISPDGEEIVFDVLDLATDGVDAYCIEVLNLATRRTRVVQKRAKQPTWLSNNLIAYVRLVPWSPKENQQIWVTDKYGDSTTAVTSYDLLHRIGP